jgi:NAD-dependent dihydropyrimidine dehydrogenase PreA subunit
MENLASRFQLPASSSFQLPASSSSQLDGDEAEVRTRLTAPAINPDQALFASGPLKQTGRLMLKDENVCVHCGLCAERCPTYAWDMRKFTVLIPHAGEQVAEPAAAGAAR